MGKNVKTRVAENPAIYTPSRLKKGEIDDLKDENHLSKYGLWWSEENGKLLLNPDYPWKSVAKKAHLLQQSIGLAPTLDSLEDRCGVTEGAKPTPGLFRSCAIDLLSLPAPDNEDEDE